MAEPRRSSDSNGGTPLWVKVQGVFVVLLVLIILGMFAGVLDIGFLPGAGGHGVPAGGH